VYSTRAVRHLRRFRAAARQEIFWSSSNCADSWSTRGGPLISLTQRLPPPYYTPLKAPPVGTRQRIVAPSGAPGDALLTQIVVTKPKLTSPLFGRRVAPTTNGGGH
jgi:hypothetical protein